MPMEVVHAQDSHAVAGPAPMGKGYDLTAAVTQTLTPVQDRSQTSLPGSQESHYSTVSKQSTTDSTAAMSSVEAVSDRQLTPTSSQSGFEMPSSPLRGPAYMTSPNATGGLPSYEPLASYDDSYDAPKSPVSVGRPASYHVDSAAGQKRTASGIVKSNRGGSTEWASHDADDQQRSRTTSTASRTSQVGELSAQLRARLTYAKVKVKHGWESRTLDEIETITSIPTSPASAKTHSTRNYQSPHSRMNGDRSGLSPAVNGSLQPADRPVTAPSRQLNYGQLPGQHHESAQQTHLAPVVGDARAHGTLAPPVDFSNPRRTLNHVHQVPSLATNGSHSTHSGSNLSSGSASLLYTAQNGHLKQTSQSAMEQDAIETLLFMRSPGNSANFGRHHQNHQNHQQSQHSNLNGTTLPPISHMVPNSEGAAAMRLGKAPGPDAHAANGTGSVASPHDLGTRRPLPFPPPRPGTLVTDSLPPVSPRKMALEESVLATANLHDNKGIDQALDEMRRRAVLEENDVDSSDDESESA